MSNKWAWFNMQPANRLLSDHLKPCYRRILAAVKRFSEYIARWWKQAIRLYDNICVCVCVLDMGLEKYIPTWSVNYGFTWVDDWSHTALFHIYIVLCFTALNMLDYFKGNVILNKLAEF